ncbi:hypothetical protein Mal64_36470 [Pseudobythopirellula maris]|uniref:Uncharacterized protein n=1 Tax=Pseudobythopirellula maris TaxID=2527991 RepID=A0A5C5ZII9_9BACT|nr:hypothetical protein [Pseudobythopirellula maris]TWT86817.1 hypothetical protein Mal64_36470 [Pseudobythopirellula maris]
MLRFERHNTQNPHPTRGARGGRAGGLPAAAWRLVSLVLAFALVATATNAIRGPRGVEAIGQLLGAPGGEQPPSPEAPPVLEPQLLESIKDNAPFRAKEREAWFALLERLDDPDHEAELAKNAAAAGYAQLVAQGDAYRGRAVRVAGVVRRVERVDPGENAVGLTSLYRVVLQGDGDSVWPITLYTIQEPPPVGETPAAGWAEGYFFKNLSYRWEEGVGVSPTVLARRVRPGPAPATIAAGHETAPPAPKQPAEQSPPMAELLALAGWPQERLDGLAEAGPLGQAGLAETMAFTRRLAQIDEAVRDAAVRGAGAVLIEGRAVAIERIDHEQGAALVEVRRADGVTATVAVADAPDDWPPCGPLDEPARLAAVAVGEDLTRAGDSRPVYAAARLVWEPDEAAGSRRLGVAMLGSLGVDFGLYDGLTDKSRLTAAESDAFYATLAAMQKTDAAQLSRLAAEGLPAYVKRIEQKRSAQPTPRGRKLAAEVSRLGDEGRYSVAPLYGAIASLRGELILLEGAVRRAVRVACPEAAARWGVDHYYELELYAPDSQNLPVVFCVPRLPAGFPLGERINQPVRMPGFLLKQWAYRTRRPADGGVEDRRQFAPLLIGAAPIPLAAPAATGSFAGAVMGGMAVLAIASLWAVNRKWAQSDKRRRAATLAEATAPDFTHLP